MEGNFKAGFTRDIMNKLSGIYRLKRFHADTITNLVLKKIVPAKNLSDYTYLGDRLSVVHNAYKTNEPKSMISFVFDTRDPKDMWNFRLVVVVSFFSVIAIVLSGVQLHYAIK